MNAYVFLGPTLPVTEARQELNAIYLPPAAQGDVYRVARKKPVMIGIVDGYFERVPAIWHKEILWAMSQGVHVFGSASMGALRAAELEAFGMEGVGRVFEAFRDGQLEDDDEVAVAHLPSEHGYRSTSVALVDIRATLAAAEDAGVIGEETRQVLLGMAKATHYAQRSFERLLGDGRAQHLNVLELEALDSWLASTGVAQKREDALEMLRTMRARAAAGLEPKRVRYHFEHTAVWEKVRLSVGSESSCDYVTDGSLFLGRMIDELRLRGDQYRLTMHAAMARCLALDESWRQGIRPTSESIQQASERFRRKNGLQELTVLDEWMKDNHLDKQAFFELMEDEARLSWLEQGAGIELASHVPDCLRISGRYAEIAGRALDKLHTLERQGLSNPTLADTGLSWEQLLDWYFHQRLGCPRPADIGDYGQRLGFPSEDLFRIFLLREFCYLSNRPPALARKEPHATMTPTAVNRDLEQQAQQKQP